MSDKVLVDKKDIVDIVSVAQKLHYASMFYYRRFANYEEVSIAGNHQPHNPVVGYVYEPSTIGTYTFNKWQSKTFDGATRVCADVYYGLNSIGNPLCIVLQGGRPSGAPSSYSAYDTIDGYVTHFSMKDSDVTKMQRMLHKQMDCREIPATNMKHFEVEGDTITLGFLNTSSSGYTPPTGYTYREYGVFVVFYDPDSIRQVEDIWPEVDDIKSMDGINNFSDIGYEAQWADAKNYLVNYMPSNFYLNIKNNGTFYGNGGYVDVNVSAPLISTMSAVEITGTNSTVSSYKFKKRTYDLSNYLTKNNQVFFLRLYVSSAASGAGSSTGYKEWLFSPLFPPLINISGDQTIVTTSTVSSGYYWITKSTGTSTFSSTASPSITTASQAYLCNSSPWTNCGWQWNPTTKQLSLVNTVTSNYYPSSPKAILYYVKA